MAAHWYKTPSLQTYSLSTYDRKHEMEFRNGSYVKLFINVSPNEYGRKIRENVHLATANFMLVTDAETAETAFKSLNPGPFYMGRYSPIEERRLRAESLTLFDDELSIRRFQKTYLDFVGLTKDAMKSLHPHAKDEAETFVMSPQDVNDVTEAVRMVLASRKDIRGLNKIVAQVEQYAWFDDEEIYFSTEDVSYRKTHLTPAKLAGAVYDTADVFVQVVKNPVNGEEGPLSAVIINLNDEQGWTFDEIADWLDTLDVNTTIASRKELL